MSSASAGRRAVQSKRRCLRDLETTLGMEPLRCKSPNMAETVLLAHWLAHNLVRCVSWLFSFLTSRD